MSPTAVKNQGVDPASSSTHDALKSVHTHKRTLHEWVVLEELLVTGVLKDKPQTLQLQHHQ